MKSPCPLSRTGSRRQWSRPGWKRRWNRNSMTILTGTGPGRSALDAVGKCRERCWRYDWGAPG